jgi:hypothetical protein
MDRIIIQIISKDQADYIPRMIEATKGFDRFWGLDRCTDNSAEILQSYGERFIENKEGEGFLAGKMRDMVLDEILQHDYDYIVMFDGDRIPFNLSKELILEEMSKYDCTFALAEKDRRRQEVHEKYDMAATAGLIVKTKFLKRVRKLSFMHNRCFHPEIDGYYGFEDTFFGACLFSLGATLRYSSLNISGSLPSGATYDKVTDLRTYTNLMGNLGVQLTMYSKLKECFELFIMLCLFIKLFVMFKYLSSDNNTSSSFLMMGLSIN